MLEFASYLAVAILVIFLYVWLSLLVGQAAGRKGRSPFVWFVLALAFGVILPAIVVAVMTLPTHETTSMGPENPRALERFKQCPMCAEEIKIAALKCRHCGSLVDI